MDLNDKTIAEMAAQLGLSGKRVSSGQKGLQSQSLASQLGVSKRDIEHLSSKSDAELEREILMVKEQLKANNVSYEKQVAMLRSIAPMLDPKQRARLNKVMEILRR